MRSTLRITVAGLLLLGSGCARNPVLPTQYGRASGPAAASVNGTSALLQMFRQAGMRVNVSRRLGGLVSQADVIVWVPDSYELPQSQVIRHFDEWLTARPDRVLVYVVKGYDGATDYWSRLAKHRPESVDIQRELARSKSVGDRVHRSLPREASCEWFRLQRTSEVWQHPISGPWSQALTSASTKLNSPTRLLPENERGTTVAEEDEVQSEVLLPLLQSGDHVLAAEYRQLHWGDGRILILSSGSWLLNLPLVEPQHRQLAERLVHECSSAQRVVFLESGESGPRISDGNHRHHALEAFTIRPFNSILLHLTILGMVFCCAMFPIFGRPKPADELVRSDFRQHVMALGDLIAKTGDATYAKQRRDYYWRQVRRDSGRTHMAEMKGKPAAEQPQLPSPEAGNPFAPVAPPDGAASDRGTTP